MVSCSRAHYPVTPGHEIVGRVLKRGRLVSGFKVGDRVGVPWLGASCGSCRYCAAGLENLCDEGRVVCAGIHMSDIPGFPYSLLWGKRSVCSVANLTRADGQDFMRLAAEIELRPSVVPFALSNANEAIERLRRGTLSGAAVLVN